MYLKKEVDRLDKIYPSSFDYISLSVTETQATNERKIDHKNLSYKVLFYDEDNVRSHKINFSKKYGTLYNLLEDLLTNKINTGNANADQISFIINLMQEYNKNDLLDKETHKRKSVFWKYEA